MHFRIAIATIVLSLPIQSLAADAAQANSYAAHPGFPRFAERMVREHGFDKAELESLFANVSRRQDIIDAITRPAEAKPWYEYKPIFLTESRIRGGVEFWQSREQDLQQSAKRFGVDPEVLVAIIGVETRYGDITGRYPVLAALSTLGFDYPPRGGFFLRELEQFLLLADEEALDVSTVQGSYAGAMGGGQFIPSSYRAYAVDMDGDGLRDLWDSWPDIIGSVANYFRKHGWRYGEPVIVPAIPTSAFNHSDLPGKLERKRVGELRRMGLTFTSGIDDDERALLVALDNGGEKEYWIGLHNFWVITRYNRSPLYAMAAHLLSREILKQHRESR
ncbi:MAG: lytic murein transglycosylase B [Gammaproteobacteria bacterium]|nr:lytic murein transglycosylase B [Gammaproteobacteria bacterium]